MIRLAIKQSLQSQMEHVKIQKDRGLRHKFKEAELSGEGVEDLSVFQESLILFCIKCTCTSPCTISRRFLIPMPRCGVSMYLHVHAQRPRLLKVKFWSILYRRANELRLYQGYKSRQDIKTFRVCRNDECRGAVAYSSAGVE